MKIILAILVLVVTEINSASDTTIEAGLDGKRTNSYKSHETIDLDIEADQKPTQFKASRTIRNSLIATGTTLGVSVVWFYGNHLLYNVGYYLAELSAPPVLK